MLKEKVPSSTSTTETVKPVVKSGEYWLDQAEYWYNHIVQELNSGKEFPHETVELMKKAASLAENAKRLIAESKTNPNPDAVKDGAIASVKAIASFKVADQWLRDSTLKFMMVTAVTTKHWSVIAECSSSL